MLTTVSRSIPTAQALKKAIESAPGLPRVQRRSWLLAGVVLSAALCAASGAQAQNCVLGPSGPINNLAAIGTSAGSVGSMVGASITSSSTAFLLQSSSFVGAPANPAPDQQGGGIWTRGVGGEVTIKSSSAITIAGTNGAGTTNTFANCTQSVRTDFAGIQFGRDISELNVNGWNLHVGATAGYLGTSSTLQGGFLQWTDPSNGGVPTGGGPFTTTTQIPFIGIYGAATKGGFFADGLVRLEYYQSSLAAPGTNLFGEQLDAHGWSFSGSAGYNWQIPNSNWFIEPSGSIIISRVNVDPLQFTTAGSTVPLNDRLPGTLTFNTIKSDIGRLGVRVGETFESGGVVWQPFAAISVWHEFGPNLTANYATNPGCCVAGGTPFSGAGTGSVSTIGTFGQYSLGVSAALAGTGWLSFVRVDYRDGPHLEGLSGTGGIRYQFSPEAPKAGIFKAKAPPVVQAVNWTGFYVGAFAGATLGTADWGYGVGGVAPHIGGFLGGGNVGYDWQTGKYVFGVVGDIAGTNTRGGMSCDPGGSTNVPVLGVPGAMFLTSCNARASWIGDIAARVGYAWDRVLLYVKGGGAWTNERFTAVCTNNNPANVSAIQCANPAQAVATGFAASTNRAGWLIGWGGQFALTQNWSAKAEANYISFGDTNVIASDGSALRVGMHVWEEKIGLDYKFNTGP